ncbi:hypothetical protein T458_11170 [Brevibacillus panacihumi W25]|uniref:Uncharacterized protein n=1 Tax=Brevibacillus panacihumi W25 TaxID=1408254 RepID=V6M975_9BACL|nr:hypothetical protein T458_11170 [Brevibacillus panacihumi W25]
MLEDLKASHASEDSKNEDDAANLATEKIANLIKQGLRRWGEPRCALILLSVLPKRSPKK